MSYPPLEQAVHDRINLPRLVRRLEKTISSENWDASNLPPQATWVKTQGTLQKLKFARKLLRNVDASRDLDDASFQRFEELRRTLDRLENMVVEVDKRVAPKPFRPDPILPTLPIPKMKVPRETAVPATSVELKVDVPEHPTHPSAEEETTTIAAQDLLLSPSETGPYLRRGSINPSTTLLSPSLPSASTSSTAGNPAFLQNSAALQEELSAQLAQMATQLKRNALHFAGSLDKDKALVLETQEKLERNHGVMTTERVRLRDHHGKSWGTTWIVMLSLVVVLVGFVMTFFVIRIT
ncbi:hypothetical protein B0H21DRAFT_777493 [Amylocystis lapponica]|nr:hypothetical protein B0H21DRAFT_777493 [Amylocystis lapponica]